MRMYCKLDEDNNVIPCLLEEWIQMYESKECDDRRRVGSNKIHGYYISTVFLGLDHGFGQNHLFFETMVFSNNKSDVYQTRCSTWKEAEEMHKKAIQWVKDGCKDEDIS